MTVLSIRINTVHFVLIMNGLHMNVVSREKIGFLLYLSFPPSTLKNRSSAPKPSFYTHRAAILAYYTFLCFLVSIQYAEILFIFRVF